MVDSFGTLWSWVRVAGSSPLGEVIWPHVQSDPVCRHGRGGGCVGPMVEERAERLQYYTVALPALSPLARVKTKSWLRLVRR